MSRVYCFNLVQTIKIFKYTRAHVLFPFMQKYIHICGSNCK